MIAGSGVAYGGDDRGQIGIGILVMFVAMIIVSAIAAGVIVNMAGMMQSQASDAGEQAVDQLVDGVQVQDRTCTISQDPVGIEEGWAHLRLRPGGEFVNLSNSTVLYTDGQVHTELEYTNESANGTHYTVMDDGEKVHVLTNRTRMARLTVNVSAVRAAELNETVAPLPNGREGTVTISTPKGAVTKIRFRAAGIAGEEQFTKC